MITLPLDLTIDGVPHRVTRIGTDAVVYHLLGLDETTNELVRITPDTPEVGMILATETTPEQVAAHVANPPIPAPLPRSQPASVVVRRLTAEELTALRTSTHPEAFRAYLLATSEGVISEADPDYDALVAVLDQLGIIAAERWSALLA